MQLKHIGIAVVIVGGALVTDSLWTRTDHIDGFEVAAKDSSVDADTNTDSARPDRFDPYMQGRRADRFDPYTEAAARHGVDLLLTQGNT
ncbi:hypothetical protein [Cupriavidus necator]|uniref:Putative signal peptide protein n=1 Tax=Cupriavidus pinatubonensis (strain JMP 134 / LMG 1197) TaxID=264198 RepID=Q46ME0_CUPPJ|nr:hypothetical protein [Cupriavidus necator]